VSQPQRDFWPDDIAVTTLVPPVAILREQASLLGEKTKGMVEGEVTTTKIPPSAHLSKNASTVFLSEGNRYDIPKSFALKEPTLVHSFYVKVPALDNYRYLLLTVLHGPELYPLALSYLITDEAVEARSYDEFVQLLRGLLSRDETVRLIQSLVAQVQH
jgi:UDP-2,3-diacylglucosamine pyrophosphatase LpxH